MKNKRPTFHPPRIQGFSLLEFLVASALSMIVLMAVTSTYFTARNLNSAATSRLGVQQELRNASTLLVRDARMAGSFGCFNMTNYTAASVISDGSESPFNLASNVSSNSLIPIAETTINYSGFAQNGSALVFQYGIDDSNPNGNVAIASSCSSIAKSSSVKDLNSAKTALKITDNQKSGTISILRHVVSAYAVGTINSQSGLYRFQLNENGSWGDPQLLVKNINSMAIRYLYVENCPESVSTDSAASSTTENFVRQTSLRTGSTATTPALIQITLNGGNAIAASSDNKVQVYNIDATVRGGNVCADRSI